MSGRATPSRPRDPVRDLGAMVAGINPVLDPVAYVFCTTTDLALAAAAQPQTWGRVRESEGETLILERAAAAALGFPDDLPMRRIELTVNSALDGVGLTAAVASALSAEAIPCNVVAAFHHDHVFVPAAMAERALAALNALQASVVRNGVPLLPRTGDEPPVTPEIVNRLHDEAP